MLAELITLVVLLCVFIFTVLMLHRYPHPKTHPTVYVLVFLGWFNSFVVITLIPYDIYLSESSSSVSLKPAWLILYWSIFIICWMIMPVMNSYYRSGEFSTIQKLKDAVKTELKFVLIISIAFTGFVIYLLVINQMGLSNIPEIFVLLSNLWGLLLLVVLLGHGLVAIPISLWQQGSLEGSLTMIQIEATNLEYKRVQIQNDLQSCRKQIIGIKVEGLGDDFEYNLGILRKECGIKEEGEYEGTEAVVLSHKEMVKLHKKVMNLRFEEDRNEW